MTIKTTAAVCINYTKSSGHFLLSQNLESISREDRFSAEYDTKLISWSLLSKYCCYCALCVL